MPDPKPDRRMWAIDRELDSASSTLAHAIAMLLRPGWTKFESAPMLTCAATGVERILKLSYVLADDSSGHVTKPSALRTLGHDLVQLGGRLDERLDQSRAAHPPYIQMLTESVHADPYLAQVLYALNRWAEANGRYRDFNILTGVLPINYPSAQELWADAEQAVLEDQNLIQRLIDDHVATLQVIAERLALSLTRWWFLQFRLWAHGVWGPTARQWSPRLDPRSAGAIATWAKQQALDV